MPERTITYWLVVDWKREKIKARKTEPSQSELGTNELKVEGEITIQKPEIEVPKLAAELKIPEPRIRRVLAEGMDVDHPDWWESVEEVFEEHPDLVEERGVDALLGKVMITDPGTPNPEDVRKEIQERLHDIHEPSEI